MGSFVIEVESVAGLIRGSHALETSDEQLDWMVAQRLVALIPALRDRRDLSRRAVAQHMRATFVLSELLQEGTRLGVDFVAFKGLGFALQSQLYEKPEHRALGDLDLWVQIDQLDLAIQAAEACGYERLHRLPEIQHYAVEEGYAVVMAHPQAGLLELHHRLWRDVDHWLNRQMFDRAQTSSIYPDLRVLTPIDLILTATVHWVQSDPRFFGWLLEIVRLIETLDQTQIDELVMQFTRAGLQSYMLLTLNQAHQIWALEVTYGKELKTRLQLTLTILERGALKFARLFSQRWGRFGVMVSRRLMRGKHRSKLSLRRWFWPHAGAVCLALKLQGKPNIRHRLIYIFSRLTSLQAC